LADLPPVVAVLWSVC